MCQFPEKTVSKLRHPQSRTTVLVRESTRQNAFANNNSSDTR